MRSRMRVLAFVGVVATVALVALMAGPAWAHVTVDPEEAPKGGFSTLTFNVPNEKDNASTVQLEIDVPTDHPIPFVSVQPKPGWTVNVEKTTLPKPVKAEGQDVTEAVSKITWSGGEIAPGQFDTFLVSAGPLPKDATQIAFKALQTYSDGDVVRWIESTPAGGAEPQHPAPALKLISSSGTHGSTASSGESSSDDSKGLATAALVVGIVGVLLGGAALVLARRRAPTG
ncbi:MAG: YcnI family protein [Actinomycetota bacterium]|nr:YcnI family protein [Actinomycetota bacterium]